MVKGKSVGQAKRTPSFASGSSVYSMRLALLPVQRLAMAVKLAAPGLAPNSDAFPGIHPNWEALSRHQPLEGEFDRGVSAHDIENRAPGCADHYR